MRHITAIVPSGQGVWISVQSSPVIHLYHVSTYNLLLELNITTSVTQMLNACDEIIRQHKLACLRVSSLCVEKGLLWIGTSAGIILNLTIPFISSTTTQIDVVPHIVGMSHGHFGHVRFLTSICALSGKDSFSSEGTSKQFSQFKYSDVTAGPSTSSAVPYSSLVISGGDGYEDFGNLTTTETAGRDDSTNHLLMWRV
ncbi:Rho guanine nucleotide exchange factor 17, partial [Stegodyphus mimosarum]